MQSKLLCWMLALALAMTACSGATHGAQPHDMSTSGHEDAARAEDTRAEEHSAQHDPLAARTLRCGSPSSEIEIGSACWTTDVNPTEAHRRDAERHRRAAADHRAAAQTLRDAEATSCAGLDELDRDISPFMQRADIASIAPLTATVQSGRQTRERVAGATVVFRAVPGMTAEWLQRVVDCHVARNAALGHDVPEMDYCPLVPHGVTAQVRSVDDGFAVDVRSDDDDTANEVLRRAQSLGAGR